MEATGESKSTILFYVKEGLVPEPEKPKSNLHLYDESSVNIIKFIKYLQTQFSYTLAQIKTLFRENRFNFSDDFSMMLRSVELMAGTSHSECYCEEDFLELSELSKETLDGYCARGWIVKQERGFSAQELKLVELFKRAETLKMNSRLFDAYVESAIKIAKIEYEVGSELLERDKAFNNEHYKLIFDTILTLKPYLFNMQTMREHQQRMEEKQS